MPKNWSEDSGQVSKWVVCTCAEVKKGFDLDLKMFPSNVLLNVLFFGRKFHIKWSSGSGVIEKVHSESMVIHRASPCTVKRLKTMSKFVFVSLPLYILMKHVAKVAVVCLLYTY